MNTVGSYKCYCLNGYMMMADGTCKARTCAMANCQYGCAVMKGEIMCQCPSPGLRLGPDRRTCHDKPESKKCKCKLDPYGRGYDCKVIKVTIEPARPATTAKPTTRVTTATVTTTTTPPTTTTTTTTKPPTTTTATTSPTTTISTTTIPPTTFLTTVATTTMPTTVATTTMPTTVATTTIQTTVPKTTIPTTVPTTTIPTTVPTTTIPTTVPTTTIPTTVPTTTIPTTVPTTTIPTTVPTTTIPTTVPTTTIPTTVPLTTIPITVPTTTIPTTVSTTVVPTTLTMETTTIPESTTTELPTTTTAATTTTSTTVTTTTTTTTTTTSTTPAAPPPTAPPTTSPLITSTLDNRIQKEITQRPRGDVHPRNRENSVFDLDFDIELGNTAEFARDDPAGSLSCSFDQGVCSWMTDREGDVRWETVNDPEGRYLTVAEAPSRRSFRGARLTIPLSSPTNSPWKGGDLCLAFRHRLHGHHIGSLQLFVRNGRSHSPAIWNRTGGHGWRQTQITLWGQGLKSVVLKGERRRGRSGEIAVDDFILRRGACGDGSRE
uniref:MAM domain-containing protein n=1 Tax=Astyanax mexicanus TaxID=7994 RepID=W5L9X0_ASTMX